MRFAICNELFEGWSLDDTFRFIRDTGYDGVELAPYTLAPTITDLTPESRRHIRRRAEQQGLKIVGLHWLLARVPGVQLNSPDAATRAATRSYLVELIRACADLGGSILVFGSPQQRNIPPEVEPGAAWEWSRDTFAHVAASAGQHGVTFCLEPLAPTETNLFGTAAEAARMVGEVDHPAFRLLLDVKAMCSEQQPATDLIRSNAAQLAHFHANDCNRREPGSGEVDFVPIFQALQDARYDDWVSIEVFDYKPDPATIARRGIDYLRRSLAAARG